MSRLASWHTCSLNCVRFLSGRERLRDTHAPLTSRTYHLLIGRQHLLDHHAVPRERAPVQRVGPIRTEGTQAWCGCRRSHGLPRQQSQRWGGRVRRRRRGRGWGGYESEQKKKTNINTLNACSFQEPDCVPPTTITRQERTLLRRGSSQIAPQSWVPNNTFNVVTVQSRRKQTFHYIFLLLLHLSYSHHTCTQFKSPASLKEAE